MAEFKIISQPKAEPIIFNYEELKAEIAAKAKTYETLVYTEENVKDAKEDRAKLNKLKTALNDERKKREKEYMQPFTDFKAQINEIIAIIDKPVQIIDAQVKEFENAEKDKKKAEIKNIWESEAHPDWIRLEQIWNERWLNKTYQLEAIKGDIQAAAAKIEKEIAAIESLPEYSFEALLTYKESLDITRAIAQAQKLAQIKKAKEEAEAKKAAEAAKKAEQEKAAAADAAPQAPQAPEPQQAQAEAPQAEETPQQEPAARWISFTAKLTVPQAAALKDFFDKNGIEFKPI